MCTQDYNDFGTTMKEMEDNYKNITRRIYQKRRENEKPKVKGCREILYEIKKKGLITKQEK